MILMMSELMLNVDVDYESKTKMIDKINTNPEVR